GLPGAGFFPLVLGAALVVLAAAIIVEGLRERAEGKPVELGHRDVLIVFAASLVVPLLFEPLGAYGALGLFGAVLLIVIAKTGIWVAIGSAVIAMVLCWYFFEVLLGLQLPGGLLDWISDWTSYGASYGTWDGTWDGMFAG